MQQEVLSLLLPQLLVLLPEKSHLIWVVVQLQQVLLRH
jgi:hypothetical protein